MALLAPMNPPIRQWQGRSVWLIGASSGIGLATAQALHAAGARVVVSARKADLLQTFVNAHPGAQAVVLDVGDAEAIARAARYVQEQQGLDVVVYCAGYYKPVRATDYDGVYPMHCHNVVHEDHAMMVRFKIVKADDPNAGK